MCECVVVGVWVGVVLRVCVDESEAKITLKVFSFNSG